MSSCCIVRIRISIAFVTVLRTITRNIHIQINGKSTGTITYFEKCCELFQPAFFLLYLAQIDFDTTNKERTSSGMVVFK